MVPYGYRIRNGEIEIDTEKAEKLEKLYRLYLDGWSIRISAEEAGIPESVASRALSNTVYLGTDVYRPIIDAAVFARVQEERRARNRSTGKQRIRRKARPVFNTFRLNPDAFSGRPKGGSAIQWLYDCIEPVAGVPCVGRNAGQEELHHESDRYSGETHANEQTGKGTEQSDPSGGLLPRLHTL